jgi:thioredoxin-related protein
MGGHLNLLLLLACQLFYGKAKSGQSRVFMQALYRFPLLLMILTANTAVLAATGYVYEYEEEKPEASPIAELSSFEQVANTARARGVPILVEFSTPWCRYCKALEEQILKPLMLNGKYKDRIIIKKMEVNTYTHITGFDGKQYSTDQISRMYDVDLYPTLVFFDASGQEVSQRIVGITVLDYVADALEKAIDEAIEATVPML